MYGSIFYESDILSLSNLTTIKNNTVSEYCTQPDHQVIYFLFFFFSTIFKSTTKTSSYALRRFSNRRDKCFITSTIYLKTKSGIVFRLNVCLFCVGNPKLLLSLQSKSQNVISYVILEYFSFRRIFADAHIRYK